MGYMFRYNPGFDLIRQAFAEGRLGDVYAIHATMCTDITDKEKRQRLAFHPGGILFDLGSHLIDMVVLLLGPPDKVTPYLRHNGNEPDGLADNALAILEYNHALVTIEVAAMEPEAFPTRRFKIAGDLGAIIVEPLEPPSARVCLRSDSGDGKTIVRNVKLDDVPRHTRDFADLALCIRGEKDFGYPKEHDYNVQRTLLLACGVTS
jgi:predicted dehydrogenase